MMTFPFEVPPTELERDLEAYVDAVFSSLVSEFLLLPKGQGFVDYPPFEQAYQRLKRVTHSFSALEPRLVLDAVQEVPLILIVLRAILGFSPPEWAYVTGQETGVEVSQGFARNLDRKIRMAPGSPLRTTNARTAALVETACKLLRSSPPAVGDERIHRLDKADTRAGLASMQHVSEMGVPYPMLLYERFLGRPFAGHRDSVSELIGGGLEAAIEDQLAVRGVSYRKTKRAERIPGFDQTPDFICPDEFNPQVVIEAKLTEDDGTARDKVTRVQHLASLSREGQPPGRRRYQVIACIAGRGFGVRREDMKKLLLATDGKVFTIKTLDRMVAESDLCRLVAQDVEGSR
jgi:hypothetical protein